MEKMTMLFCSLFIICSACSRHAEGEKYGETLTLTATTDISEILSRPEDFVGQRVLITGEIADVCQKKGCWIDLISGNEKIRVKVEDDVIVFPTTAKGKIAVVEGVLEKLELSEEELVEWKRHEAEERGEQFDPASVSEGTAIYRIKGSGAVVKDAG